jgi:hypothetical protein
MAANLRPLSPNNLNLPRPLGSFALLGSPVRNSDHHGQMLGKQGSTSSRFFQISNGADNDRQLPSPLVWEFRRGKSVPGGLT